MNTPISFVRNASLAVLFALAAGMPAAHAQGTQTLAKATVPFAFHYGTRVFPAGQYTFAMISDNILEVHGTQSSALGVVTWDEDVKKSEPGRLVFRHSGDQYNLQDIWIPRLSAHLRLPQVKPRKHTEMAEAKPTGSEVQVALLESSR